MKGKCQFLIGNVNRYRSECCINLGILCQFLLGNVNKKNMCKISDYPGLCQFLLGNVNNCIYQLFFFIILPLLFKINYFPQKSTSTYFISESL